MGSVSRAVACRGQSERTQLASRRMASVAGTSGHRLAGVLAVTDPALSSLKVEDFLTELGLVHKDEMSDGYRSTLIRTSSLQGSDGRGW